MIFVVCLNWDLWGLCGIFGIRGWLFGVLRWGRWWRGESFWPRASLVPRLGPRPPSGRGGLLVVDGGFMLVAEGCGRAGGFGLGSLSFCEGRFASFAVLGPFTNGPYEWH